MTGDGTGRPGDLRSGRVVLLGACLLDQNCRFPGIAVAPGACADLVAGLVEAGVGIQALPCLECREWGGVARPRVTRLFPGLYRAAGTRWFGVVRVLARPLLGWYRLRCRRAARRVVRRVADLLAAGIEVVGIVAMDDSPTCGVTRTLDPIEFVPAFKERGHTLEDLLHPAPGVFDRAVVDALRDGPGVFVGELRRQLARRRLAVPIEGYDPWVPDHGAEAARVAGALGYRAG